MQAHEPGDGPAGLAGVVLGVLLGGLLDLPERLVRGVVRQDVHDEALLDCLPHRVQVEGLIDVRLGVEAAEHLQRPALGRRSEREVGQVRLPPAPRADRLRERLLDRVDRRSDQTGVFRFCGCQLLLFARSERQPEVLGSLAGLGGVGLVDDDGVVAGRQSPDLVQDERELLQGSDDDPRLLTRQRLGQLPGVLVNLHNQAAGVLELVDGVLQLPVQDHPIGDHHDLVEDLTVLSIVEGGQPVRRPGDRVRLPRPCTVLDEIGAAWTVGSRIGLKLEHRVPLVEAGEDHHLRRAPRADRALLRAIDVDETVQDVQPGVPGPDPLPQV